MADSIRALHVDDDPDFADLTSIYLQQENEEFAIETGTNASEGREKLAGGEYDCVVSDYEMPGMDGVEFLREVRAEHPKLPFILFTGRGSEEVASEAISAGVTDYLQKDTGTEQFELLANRIQNAVETAEAKTQARQSKERFQRLSEVFPDIAFYIDEDGRYIDFIAGEESPLLYDAAEELVGQTFHELLPGETADRFLATVRSVLDSGTQETIEYQLDVQVGRRWFEAEIVPLKTPLAGQRAVIWVARDITDRKERERTLRNRSERLEAIHDAVRELSQLESKEGIATRTVAAVAEIPGFELARVRYYDSTEEELVPVADSDDAGEQFERHPVDIPEDNNPVWRVFESGEPERYDDASAIGTAGDSELPSWSLVIQPLGTHGTLTAGTRGPDAFDRRDLALTGILATNVEMALARIEESDRWDRRARRENGP